MGDMSREPSMEDILSSIRRVIARDETPGTVREARVAEADDILDLQEQEDRAAAKEAPEARELVSEASADAARQSLEALTAAVTPGAAAAPAAAAPAAIVITVEIGSVNP